MATRLSGDLPENFLAIFNAEDRRPRDDFRDYFEAVPTRTQGRVSIELLNEKLADGIRARLSFSTDALPGFGVWRAFQSGVYALALEPMYAPMGNAEDEASYAVLTAGQEKTYWLELHLSSSV